MASGSLSRFKDDAGDGAAAGVSPSFADAGVDADSVGPIVDAEAFRLGCGAARFAAFAAHVLGGDLGDPIALGDEALAGGEVATLDAGGVETEA